MQLYSSRVRASVLVALAAGSLAVGSLAGAPATADQSRDAQRTYAAKAKAKNKDFVKLDLLALNDFHGNLEPPTGSSGRINSTSAGGAAYLATVLREERRKSRAAGARPITVAAGDLIGASPLLSAAFHDEPTIEALNRMRLQIASVGNHEFDEGVRELRRMQRGGCLDDGDGENNQDSCPEGRRFEGADFRYLAANVHWKNDAAHKRDTIFPAVKVMRVKKERVAFIGMTLEGTPNIVSQAGIRNVEFADEVKTANALVPKLRKRGIKSIVVLLHEGVAPANGSSAYNDCDAVSGPALRIAQDLKPAIDAVVSGHTHQPYNCVVRDPKGQPRLLTSASSFGRMVTKLHFLIDPRSGDIVRPAAYARNMIAENGPGERAAPRIQSLIEEFKRLVAPIANQVVGHVAPSGSGPDAITEETDPDGGDSALGNLIADAQKADDTVDDQGEPAVAFMNPGGIRADLVENAANDVTYEAAFTVQPFNNFVVSMDLTGAQIMQLLNDQWNGANEGDNLILQVAGLDYTWDESLAAEDGANAVVGPVSIDHDGDPDTPMVPLVDGETYRVVANNFIADGGDGLPTFTEGTSRLIGGLDIDSLVDYLGAHDPVSPSPTNRISSQP